MQRIVSTLFGVGWFDAGAMEQTCPGLVRSVKATFSQSRTVDESRAKATAEAVRSRAFAIERLANSKTDL